LLTSSFAFQIRGQVLGIATGSVYLGLSLGPSIGGYLTDVYGWQSIFYVGSFAGLISLLVVIKYLDYRRIPNESAFNIKGALHFAISIGLTYFGYSNLQHDGLYITLMILGLISFYFFWRNQLKSDQPILDIPLLKSNKPFALGNTITMINYASSTAIVFTFSLYLQYIKGLSAHEAGMILIVQPIIQAIFAPIAGRMSDRINPNLLVLLGMLSCAIGLMITLTINQESSIIKIYGLLSFFGLGFALFSTANINQIMSSVTNKHYGVASSMVATMRTVGMLISISIATGAFTVFVGDKQMQTDLVPLFLKGVNLSFAIFLLLSVAGLFMAAKLYKIGKARKVKL